MRPFAPLAAAATLAAVLATACTPASPSASPPNSAGASSSSTPGASSSPALLTGTQLKSLLAPESWFPHGFKADPGGAVDTGGYYQPPSPPGHLKCRRLGATGWVALADVGAVSFAQNDYINHKTVEEYAQEIDVYRGKGARDVMTALRKLAHTCPSYRDPDTGSTVTVTVAKGPHLGDDALTLTLKSPQWAGGTTLVAVRAGTAVITVLYSAASGTGKKGASKLASTITSRVQQKA